MGCSQGAQARMAFDLDSTFDGSSYPMDFLYESLAKEGTIVGGHGITGTRSENVERTRLGSYLISGKIGLQPGPIDYDFFLPWILGAPESNDVFALAESLPSRSVLIDRVGSIFRYDTCYVNRAVLRAKGGPGDSEAELVELILDIMGTTETGGATWAGTIPALSVAATRSPYLFGEGVFTVNSQPYEIKDFALVIDNMLQPRWVNSLSPSAICPSGRRVMLVTNNPFTSTEYAALYNNANALAGIAGRLKFTNGNMSAQLDMAGLQWADQSPTVEGKREIPLTLQFYVRKKGSTAELIWTNDSTP
jgi:hypothetical protein